MGNYSLEYKKYYEGLKKDSNDKVYNYKIEDYLGRTNGYSRNTYNKSGNKVAATIINIFTLQLVGTVILLFLVFGAKYSSDDNLEKYYESFKASINKEYSIDDFQEDVKSVSTSNIVEEIKSSVEWFKEKVETNPLNY